MTQEDRKLLLTDLCARLPYRIKFKDDYEEYTREIHYIRDEDIYIREYRNLPYWIDTIKPYLRSMSSMTEGERHIFDTITRGYTVHQQVSLFDWLNSHHFDYRGLIEKGLALEAPERMYNIKKE